MLRLAGEEGDGAIVNWLSAEDVRRPRRTSMTEIVAAVFVVPSDDFVVIHAFRGAPDRRYLTVRTYATFQAWLGRARRCSRCRTRREAGDPPPRRGDPGRMINDLIVWARPSASAPASSGTRRTA